MQESWEEWRRKGKLFKVNNGGERSPFFAQPKEEEWVFIPQSKNLTVVVLRAEYPGQIGAEYPPPDFPAKNPAKKSAPITRSKPLETPTRKR
jgi:hypothetical protein